MIENQIKLLKDYNVEYKLIISGQRFLDKSSYKSVSCKSVVRSL